MIRLSVAAAPTHFLWCLREEVKSREIEMVGGQCEDRGSGLKPGQGYRQARPGQAPSWARCQTFFSLGSRTQAQTQLESGLEPDSKLTWPDGPQVHIIPFPAEL